MTKKELMAMVVEYKEYKAMKKEIDEAMERFEAAMKKELARKEVSELAVGDVVIRNTPFVQSRFDSKAFKAENPEMYGQFVREVKGSRFSVS